MRVLDLPVVALVTYIHRAILRFIADKIYWVFGDF